MLASTESPKWGRTDRFVRDVDSSEAELSSAPYNRPATDKFNWWTARTFVGALAATFMPTHAHPVDDNLVASVQIPDPHSELSNELASLRELEAGWDGPESLAPSSEAINEALRFLRALPFEIARKIEVAVAADGEVGFSAIEDDYYLDIGFRGTGEVVYFIRSGEDRFKGKASLVESNVLPRDLILALTV